jgi:hypothetical protein
MENRCQIVNGKLLALRVSPSACKRLSDYRSFHELFSDVTTDDFTRTCNCYDAYARLAPL